VRITRLVASAEGDSRFTECDIPLLSRKIAEAPMHASNGFVSPSVIVVETPEGAEAGWHGATARQLVVILSGVLEVEMGNGEKKQWGAGEVFLADDVAGRHLTRAVGGPMRLLFIPFAADFVIDTWSEKS